MVLVAKSIIGKYFSYNKENNSSTCKTCPSIIKGNHGSNLKKHLKQHGDIYEEYLIKELDKFKPKELVLVNKTCVDLYQFLKPTIKVKTDMKTLIKACVELVTVNGRPYSMLDDSGFQNIINPILSGIQNSVVLNSSSIKKYDQSEAQLLINQISEDVASKLISLKVDAVTRCNRAFLGINVQYIVNGCIKLKTIGLVELTESHTGIYLKDVILKVVNQNQNASDGNIPTDPIDDLEIYLRSKVNDESTSSDFGTLSNSQTQTIEIKIETLLKSFIMEEKRLGHKNNIIQFWKSKELVYPELFELSNIVISVPATQVSVERLFSGLKFVLSPYRCNITSTNLENQLLVRTYMLFEKNTKNLQGAST